MKRLESLSAALSRDFRDADGGRQKSALLSVCRIAASSLGTDEWNEAIAALSQEKWSDAALHAKLSKLSKEFYDKYLGKADSATRSFSSDEKTLFRSARLASAFESALSGKPDKLEEALYEAIFACENQAVGISAASAALLNSVSSRHESHPA